MAEVDWTKIKNEYVTTTISYRGLSDKYKIPLTTIAGQAKQENWVKAREQFRHKVETKTLSEAEKKQSQVKNALYDLAVSLARQLSEIADKSSLADLAAIGLKPRDITGAAKDLNDIMHIKTEADIREQEARIANLRKQAESADDASKQITITIAGNAEEYAE